MLLHTNFIAALHHLHLLHLLPSSSSASLWLSWCDSGLVTEGPLIFLRPASSRAQAVSRGQTTWSTVLSGLDGPSDTSHTTNFSGLVKVSLFCCTAGTAVTQAQTFTQSITGFQGESITGLQARSLVPTTFKTLDQNPPSPSPPDERGRSA